MENYFKAYGYSCRETSNSYFFVFCLHNFCERQKTDVDAALVEKIIQEERLNKTFDRIHSYTTPLGREVRDAITSYFKEYL